MLIVDRASVLQVITRKTRVKEGAGHTTAKTTMLIRFGHTALDVVVIAIWPQTVDVHAATATDFRITGRGDVIGAGFFGEFDALASAFLTVKPAVKDTPYMVRARRKARYGRVNLAHRSHRMIEHFSPALALRTAMQKFTAAKDTPCPRLYFSSSRDVHTVNHI